MSLTENQRALPVEPRDGLFARRLSGPLEIVERVDWPLTRVPSGEARGLAEFPALNDLDLSGEHFPTTAVDAAGLQDLGADVLALSLHGAYIRAADLLPALSVLQRLRRLDVRGVDLNDDDVALLVARCMKLRSLAVGMKPAEIGDHQFTTGRLTPDSVALLARLPSLQSLAVRGMRVDDSSVLANASMFNRLEYLDIGDSPIGNIAAGALSQAPWMQTLLVDGTEIGDQGAVSLASSTNLASIDISYTRVESSGLRCLSSRPGLRCLIARGLRTIGDDTVEPLAGSDRLEVIDLSYTAISDISAQRIAALAGIRRVSFDGTGVTAIGASALARSNADEISLAGCQLGPEGVAALAQSPIVQRLRLSADIGWPGVGALQAAEIELNATDSATSASRKLKLPDGTRVLNFDGSLNVPILRAAGRVPSLGSMSVRDGAHHLAARELSSFSRLRTLAAESSGLNKAALDSVAELPCLEALFISRNDVSASVSRLQGRFIHTLELRDTLVDDSAVEALAMLPRLHCLDLPGTHVSSGAIARLVAAAANLQSLAVDGAQLDALSAGAVAANPRIVELYLYGPSVNDATIARISEASNIRDVSLFGTSATDASTPVLASMSGLRSLNLSGRNSDEIATSLQARRTDVFIRKSFAASVVSQRKEYHNSGPSSRGALLLRHDAPAGRASPFSTA